MGVRDQQRHQQHALDGGDEPPRSQALDQAGGQDHLEGDGHHHGQEWRPRGSPVDTSPHAARSSHAPGGDATGECCRAVAGVSVMGQFLPPPAFSLCLHHPPTNPWLRRSSRSGGHRSLLPSSGASP